jgi:long-chain acyl-CoA synthetase
VFARSRRPVVEALDRLMAEMRARGPGAVNLEEEVAAIRASVNPTADTDYFLARMTFRHLTPTDEATLISLPTGERQVTDVAVTVTGADGERYVVRGPVSPREVARLLQLFHASNLQVVFSPEHEFLLAVDGREVVVGGLFYRLIGRERAHLEKIVVDRRHRKKGIGDGLMREFMRRLRGHGVEVLETGFFHPQYMMRFGFRTEPRYGGLARDLRVDAGGRG